MLLYVVVIKSSSYLPYLITFRSDLGRLSAKLDYNPGIVKPVLTSFVEAYILIDLPSKATDCHYSVYFLNSATVGLEMYICCNSTPVACF